MEDSDLFTILSRLADETAVSKETLQALLAYVEDEPPGELGAALISAFASLRTAEEELRRCAQLAASHHA